jgi:hypothetical protein
MSQEERTWGLSVERNSLLLLLALMMVVIFTCCATIPKEEDLGGSLKSAAEEYWNKRMKSQYEDTYGMEDKAGLPAFEDYREKAMLMKKLDIRAHSVKEVAVSGDEGTVNVQFDLMLPHIFKAVSQVLKDGWVYKNGKWRHVFR